MVNDMRQKMRFEILNIVKNCLISSPTFSKMTLFVLRPLSNFDFIKGRLRYIERSLSYTRILSPGDIAIQAGICMDGYDPQLFDIARTVGKNGIVIGIEPDPKNIKKLKAIINKNKFKCKFIIFERGAYSRSSESRLCLGKQSSWNRLDSMCHSSWIENVNTYTDEEIPIIVDTIDNMLTEVGINPREVSYVNLTINGAEYDALMGMKNILETCENLTISAVSGRITLRHEKDDLGWINGKPDEVVISDLLTKFGFEVKFKPFFHNKFGYVLGKKGNKKFLEWQ